MTFIAYFIHYLDQYDFQIGYEYAVLAGLSIHLNTQKVASRHNLD